MKKYFFMAVAAIAALSSCSNYDEFEQNQTGNQGLVFTATMEGSEGTRATYDSDKKCAAWEAGDHININGKTYSALTAGTTTTFKADDKVATGTTYTAYFPADLYNNDTPALPANVSETWAEGKFNMPMYATSETTSLKFYNLCGVLKITVKKSQLASVKCITVSSTNCATSGAFNVTDKKAVLTDASNTANTVTVTYTNAVSTDAADKVFYVAIPAQTYQNLSIAVSDGTTTKVMTTKANQSITVDRNKIYHITFADNAAPATTGTAKATIDGEEVDVKWVQLWEDGPKFAEYNVEGKMTFTQATADSFTWGANWCTPSKGGMEHLMTAAMGKTDEKVKCEYTQENSQYGFKFTGLTDGYTSNSVFFPVETVFDTGGGCANYWSGTAESGKMWIMYLSCGNNFWSSNWLSLKNDCDCLVRPVLTN